MQIVKKKYESLSQVLICSLAPYFLEKENFWFEKNYQKILEARKTQSFFADNLLLIEKDQYIKFSELLRRLDELGYEKVEKIEEIGEFALRGGIIDIFPINLCYPLRIEFSGNSVANIFKLRKEIENEKTAKERLKKKLKSQKLFSELKGLKPGDYLVHLDHGVGRFLGIKRNLPERKDINQQEGEKSLNYYLLEYAQGDKLYVPFGLERKLSLYIGFREPKLSRLGSPLWQRTKRKIKKEAEKLAKELLEIYAKREIAKRPPYSVDSLFDLEIKGSFSFEETPDQVKVIEEVKRDLEREKPMDRIICGDSGFGKTEVALRAMIKAVSSGYQAVMICPTTILAAQHYQNFRTRLKNLPLKITLLTRLQSKKEQQIIIENLKNGKVDIVIGTHRLLSKDISFKNLQLLIIDEEQRFGVKQKEKLKKLKASLDVLSLSATPIPRTLYLALSNLRDISFVQTPPPGRKPVKTIIQPWKEEIIKKAIDFEIKRGGQVYYLHNKIETITLIKRVLEKLAKKSQVFWKIAIAHGKLKEKELIAVMRKFQAKKINILIATTIIETGLDFPHVNTLIVADATRLGLAQAYQIRGRVGRSPVPAFAYFLYPSKLSKKAKMRLESLKEAEILGAGFKIAQRDLEIRGAGNILGKEQSGNVNAVGLNLYCQMIAEAIEKMRLNS